METKTLEQRSKELKRRLSELGKAIYEGKYWITKHGKDLREKKEQLLLLKKEYKELIHINFNKINKRTAIDLVEEEIVSIKKQLKEEEKDQRNLTDEVKKVNREYSKLESRIIRKKYNTHFKLFSRKK